MDAVSLVRSVKKLQLYVVTHTHWTKLYERISLRIPW